MCQSSRAMALTLLTFGSLGIISDFCGSRTGIADLYVFLRTAWTGKGFALSSGADDESSQNAS